jgi:chromosomal replication initiation ATPase DnaA
MIEKRIIKETTYLGLDVVSKIGLDRILQVVCTHFGVDVEQVKGVGRKAELTEARHYYCFLASKAYCGYKLVQIGKEVNRDHATVLHAKRKLLNYLDVDLETVNHVKVLMQKLGRFTSEDIENNEIGPNHVGWYTTAKRKEQLKAMFL